MSSDLREKLLDAALLHVPFDGWGSAGLNAGARDISVSTKAAQALFPRGAPEMAQAFHQRGDDAMAARMNAPATGTMRYSEKVAAAVWFRLEAVGDKDVARRSMTLFSLPQNAPDGARLIWGTADRIWCALGDTSDDVNWYSKRAILAGVYASSLLFWLGDNSPGQSASRDFVNRRIANVMQFEKFKSRLRDDPAVSRLMKIPNSFLSRIRAPERAARDDLPGHWPASGRR
ncbi:MAG: COQ9 family protein [Paracoccaceae bacterium]